MRVPLQAVMRASLHDKKTHERLGRFGLPALRYTSNKLAG